MSRSLSHAPLFSVGWCRTLGPHQSPIRFKALGDFSKENFIPPLANFVAPENCRYHAVSKVITDHRSTGSPLRASNPNVAHGAGVPSDQIIAELSIVRDGTAANQASWLLTNPYASSLPRPNRECSMSGKRLGDIERNLLFHNVINKPHT